MDAKVLSHSLNKSQLIEQVESISSRKLKEADFALLNNLVSKIGDAVRKNELDKSDVAYITRCFGDDFMNNTIHGHCVRKPFGYAGDYILIDKMYTYYVSENEKYKCWDQYVHSQAGTKAVRNRKAYFKAKMKHKLAVAGNDTLELLNVASGPARDVSELYSEIASPNKLNTTCIDLDKNAIEYAKELNQQYSENVQFIHANVLRFRTDKKYDIIWSAGLFDYFNDRAFILLLTRFKDWLKPGGEIIIGNFNADNNPSRDYMEYFGEWFLIHRTEEQLISLAMKAGFEFYQLSVGREKGNVNLFLHIKG